MVAADSSRDIAPRVPVSTMILPMKGPLVAALGGAPSFQCTPAARRAVISESWAMRPYTMQHEKRTVAGTVYGNVFGINNGTT